MKKLLIFAICLFYQNLQAQTVFEVKNQEDSLVIQSLVFRHKEYLGETDQQGRITLNGIKKGDKITFRNHDYYAFYIATENNPKQIQVVSLLSIYPHYECIPPEGPSPDKTPELKEEYAQFPGGMEAIYCTES